MQLRLSGKSQSRTFDRVQPYSAPGAGGTRKGRDDLWTGTKCRIKLQIIIYAHSGQFWVQPWPLTSDRDGDR
jgi:hypothetical protein